MVMSLHNILEEILSSNSNNCCLLYFNPYVAIGGGYFTPRRTFCPIALKPLRIVTKAFVTFPEYMWAKKC